MPGITERFVQTHLPRFSELKNGANDLLKRGFGVNTIAERLGMERETVGKHLVKNSELKKLPNELLTKGLLPNTIAEKLGWATWWCLNVRLSNRFEGSYLLRCRILYLSASGEIEF